MQCRAWRSDEVGGENKDLWHGESAMTEMQTSLRS